MEAEKVPQKDPTSKSIFMSRERRFIEKES